MAAGQRLAVLVRAPAACWPVQHSILSVDRSQRCATVMHLDGQQGFLSTTSLDCRTARVMWAWAHPSCYQQRRSDWWWCFWCAAGGMSESLLLQLGKLPRLAPADGDDTDRDAGSEATDVGDLGDAMDIS